MTQLEPTTSVDHVSPNKSIISLGIPAAVLVRTVVALRIFFGVVWASNVIAKVLDRGTFDWGFVTFNLVDRVGARGILEQGVGSTAIGPLASLYRNVPLAHWEFFQYFLIAAEFCVAFGLLFGVATRLAALGGILLLVPVGLMLLTTDQYLWTYPLDIFPLILLALVPAGRVAGGDRMLAARFGGRWPF